MTMMAAHSSRLIDRLPAVRGSYEENVTLADMSWFRVGGPAEVLFRPADEADLAQFLRCRPADVPVTVLGVCSNTLVRDGGIDGVVIRLGQGFAGVEVAAPHIRAGAGMPNVSLALSARDAAITGFEFLRGVPGTVGGSLRMNAGAYGREMADLVVHVTAIDAAGELHSLSRDEMGYGYRRCGVPADWIFVSALMRGEPGDRDEISRRMDEISAERAFSQPVRSRTGGSTFKNPPPEAAGGKRAWELIEQAGCRGLTVGGAMVSEQHCNFLINSGTATAGDLEALGEEVRRRVRAACGIELEWEIRIIGRPA
jgi:UDP-N-acetylmuramate dehydrogenase